MINWKPIDNRFYRFHPDGLDPVTVYVEQFEESSSRIIVQCYARAWTAYWGAHGKNSVEQFVSNCNAEYVADNLSWGLNGIVLKRREKTERAYLLRIVQAIQEQWRPLFKEQT